jgi:hypothetical protein
MIISFFRKLLDQFSQELKQSTSVGPPQRTLKELRSSPMRRVSSDSMGKEVPLLSIPIINTTKGEFRIEEV